MSFYLDIVEHRFVLLDMWKAFLWLNSMEHLMIEDILSNQRNKHMDDQHFPRDHKDFHNYLLDELIVQDFLLERQKCSVRQNTR